MRPTVSKILQVFGYVLFISLVTACGSEGQSVAQANPGSLGLEILGIDEGQTTDTQILQTKTFDQCASASTFKAQIQFSKSSSQENQSGLAIRTTAGGEAEIPLALRAKFEAAIEAYVKSTGIETSGHEEIASIEVPAYTHQEYTITWKEIRRQGSVRYVENGVTKTANFSIRTGLELVSTTVKDLSCPNKPTQLAGAEVTETVQVALAQVTATEATTPIPTPLSKLDLQATARAAQANATSLAQRSQGEATAAALGTLAPDGATATIQAAQAAQVATETAKPTVTPTILPTATSTATNSPMPPTPTATQSWTTGANAPTARAQASAGVIGGKLYVIGGDNGQAIFSRLEIYDPKTDRWSSGADMPTVRFDASVGVIGDRLYVIGGKANPFTHQLEIYDSVKNTWTKGADMPTSRLNASVGVIGDKIYVVGGQGESNDNLGSMDIYDVKSDRWSFGARKPTQFLTVGSGVVGDKLYTVGGGVGSTSCIIEIYDSIKDSWERGADGPTGACFLDAAGMIRDKLFVVGHRNGMTQILIYEPMTNEWKTWSNSSSGLPAFSAVGVIGGKFYFVGGWTAYAVNSLLIYDPSSP